MLSKTSGGAVAPCLRANGLLAVVPFNMMQTAPCESEFVKIGCRCLRTENLNDLVNSIFRLKRGEDMAQMSRGPRGKSKLNPSPCQGEVRRGSPATPCPPAEALA